MYVKMRFIVQASSPLLVSYLQHFVFFMCVYISTNDGGIQGVMMGKHLKNLFLFNLSNFMN